MDNAPAQILIVDDDRDGLEVLSRILTLKGYTVQIANGAALAKQMCDQHRFDVIISDIGLPDRTGHELMREIKGQYGIPGIAFSGHSSSDDVAKSLEAGFSFHIVKPIQSEKLVEAIRKVLSDRIIPR